MKHITTAIIVLTIQAQFAFASPESNIFPILLCFPPTTSEASGAFDALLKKSIGQNQDGGFALEGNFKSGDACIRNVTVGGAFGVAMVMAEVCEGKVTPLLELVRARRPHLKESRGIIKQPGIIAAYEDGEYGITFFQGAPTFIQRPDPQSKIVSYVCVRKGSGPQ